MKISNETKVGALTSIAIVLLIIGFSFLKGTGIFQTGEFLYAEFEDAKGIKVSNPITTNGYQIGTVSKIENKDKTLKRIKITLKLNESSYQIPDDSYAEISSNPLGVSSIEIKLGNSNTFLKKSSQIKTQESAGILSAITNGITPAVEQLKTTFHTLDSTLKNINSVFDANAKNNLQQTIANINHLTTSLITSAASLEKMLAEQSGSIAKTMDNMNNFTQNLAANNDKINNTISNIEKTTNNLSQADIVGSVSALKESITKINDLLAKINSKDGSLGLLMNDKTLYNNLTNTVRSANILLDDLKTHPKRYVNISVFGKKDKSTPLTAPLNETNP
ncbi:MAG: MCE family protein [Chitinophagaceae bacterium]|nr:MCE family protein [Chitinophagaceae bacterium]MCW5905538.1 MCE family protein [Chitinophagaceae bacterium]